MAAFQKACDVGLQSNGFFEVSWITSNSLAEATNPVGICENSNPSYLDVSNPSTPSSDMNRVHAPGIKESIVNLADITNNVMTDGKCGTHHPGLRTYSEGAGLGIPIEECGFPLPEGTTSVGSNGGTDCSSRSLESGSILAGTMSDLLPQMIDDTGCTQDALNQVLELEIMANAVHRLGANKSQLLLHLLKSSNEFMMKNGKKRKGKGGRRPAADPRVDPSIDPKKAKRIVANRKSAAKSKEKQKKEAAGLKIRHDACLCQLQAMVFEERFLEECRIRIENEKKSLEAHAEELRRKGEKTELAITELLEEKKKLCWQQDLGSTGNVCTVVQPVNSSLDDSSMEKYQCAANTSVTASPIGNQDTHDSPESDAKVAAMASAAPPAPPDCAFETPNSMLPFEDGGRDTMWDFGLQHQEADMVDWNNW